MSAGLTCPLSPRLSLGHPTWTCLLPASFFCFVFRLIYLSIYLFIERGKERERNINVREKHQSVASCTLPTEHLAQNPGICPDQASNQQPFRLQDEAQPTGPHQSWHSSHILCVLRFSPSSSSLVPSLIQASGLEPGSHPSLSPSIRVISKAMHFTLATPPKHGLLDATLDQAATVVPLCSVVVACCPKLPAWSWLLVIPKYRSTPWGKVEFPTAGHTQYSSCVSLPAVSTLTSHRDPKEAKQETQSEASPR